MKKNKWQARYALWDGQLSEVSTQSEAFRFSRSEDLRLNLGTTFALELFGSLPVYNMPYLRHDKGYAE